MNNIRFYKLWVAMSALTFSLVHCSMPDDVKATKANSEQLIVKSQSLVDRTSNLFGGARKDLGFERSTERYKDIVDADGDSAKILYATAFSSGYEFQQWTGTETDTADLKDRMYTKAMRDVLVRFESLTNHDYDVNPIMLFIFPRIPNNDWKSRASLAVAMGEVDVDQQIAFNKSGVGVESLYSLIVKGLQYKKVSLYDDKNIPDFAKEVLHWEAEAVNLLQLRHNYFMAMVMSRFSDYSTNKPAEALTWLNVKGFGFSALATPLEIKYMDNVIKLQDQGTLWLQQAQETQRVLEMLGYPLQFNKAIVDIFNTVHFEASPDLVDYPSIDSTYRELNKVVGELQTSGKSLLATPGSIPDKLILNPAILKTAMLNHPKKKH